MVTIKARCLGHLACACRSWLGNMRALQVVVHSHLHLSHFHFVFKSLSIWFSTLLFNVAMAECCLKPRPQSLMVGFIQALTRRLSSLQVNSSLLKIRSQPMLPQFCNANGQPSGSLQITVLICAPKSLSSSLRLTLVILQSSTVMSFTQEVHL